MEAPDATESFDFLTEGREAWLRIVDPDRNDEKSEYLGLLHYDNIINILNCLRAEVYLILFCTEKGLLALATDEAIAALILEKLEMFDLLENIAEDCIHELAFDYQKRFIDQATERAALSIGISVEDYTQKIHNPVMEKMNELYSLSAADEAEMRASKEKHARVQNIVQKVLETHLERIKSGAWQAPD